MAGIGAAVIGGGSSLLGGLLGSNASSKAAEQQAAAAQAAIAEQQRQYNQTRSDLGGYRDIGASAGNMLTNALPSLTANWDPTTANLEQTPGYNFTLSQGLKGAQNSAAARGLGISGAALKGASTYATGLADSTWQNVFNADQTQKTNIYNKLYGTTALGETAAAQTGVLGQQAANAISGITTSNGNAQGAATIAGTNALTGGLTGAANAYTQYNALNALTGGGLYGGSGNSGRMSGNYGYGAGGYYGAGPYAG